MRADFSLKLILAALSCWALSACGSHNPGPKPAPVAPKATAACSQTYLDSCREVNASLAKWSRSGSNSSDQSVARQCRSLLAQQTDFCQVKCSSLSSSSEAYGEFCPSMDGQLAGADAVEGCRSFQKRGNTKVAQGQ